MSARQTTPGPSPPSLIPMRSHLQTKPNESSPLDRHNGTSLRPYSARGSSSCPRSDFLAVATHASYFSRSTEQVGHHRWKTKISCPPISERQDSWNQSHTTAHELGRKTTSTALDDEQRSRSDSGSPLDLEEIEMPTTCARTSSGCGFGFPDRPQSGVKRRVSRLGNLPHSLLKIHQGESPPKVLGEAQGRLDCDSKRIMHRAQEEPGGKIHATQQPSPAQYGLLMSIHAKMRRT